MNNIIVITINGTQFICTIDDIEKSKLNNIKQFAKSMNFKTLQNLSDQNIYNFFKKQINKKFNIKFKKIPITDVIRINIR